MTPYSSGTMQQVGIHEGFDPGYQKDQLARKKKMGESPQTINDGNGGWGRSR